MKGTILGFAVLSFVAGAAVAQGDIEFIAGVHPDRRPEGAPVVSTFPKDDAWFERALTGISQPYPFSLRFLEDQGAWFTPFNHPGMTGRYDIRGFHQASGAVPGLQQQGPAPSKAR